jgi:hypothetical protein
MPDEMRRLGRAGPPASQRVSARRRRCRNIGSSARSGLAARQLSVRGLPRPGGWPAAHQHHRSARSSDAGQRDGYGRRLARPVRARRPPGRLHQDLARQPADGRSRWPDRGCEAAMDGRGLPHRATSRLLAGLPHQRRNAAALPAATAVGRLHAAARRACRARRRAHRRHDHRVRTGDQLRPAVRRARRGDAGQPGLHWPADRPTHGQPLPRSGPHPCNCCPALSAPPTAANPACSTASAQRDCCAPTTRPLSTAWPQRRSPSATGTRPRNCARQGR